MGSNSSKLDPPTAQAVFQQIAAQMPIPGIGPAPAAAPDTPAALRASQPAPTSAPDAPRAPQPILTPEDAIHKKEVERLKKKNEILELEQIRLKLELENATLRRRIAATNQAQVPLRVGYYQLVPRTATVTPVTQANGTLAHRPTAPTTVAPALQPRGASRPSTPRATPYPIRQSSMNLRNQTTPIIRGSAGARGASSRGCCGK